MRATPMPYATPQSAPPPHFPTATADDANGMPPFEPLSLQTFQQAQARHVPVFLVIGAILPAFAEPSLAAQIRERTVAAYLHPGARPDVELLCQRAGALFSGEGALPLCALLLDDARPFLAAPLPPTGFALDSARLFVWLTQADRRLAQNPPAMQAQAAQVVRALCPPPLKRAYAPQDAAHDLARALSACEDKYAGGFMGVKSPTVCALRFWQHAAARGDRHAHAALNRALEAMLASDLYDPLDGTFFRATLTDDWRVCVPEKPPALNALLALILLEMGQRSEAVRALDFLLNAAMPGGALPAFLTLPPSALGFTPEQVCATLGHEDGLRASRLLRLRRQHTDAPPPVTPSRFSPVDAPPRHARLDDDSARTPTREPGLTPEDAAFLHRVMPALLRARRVRAVPQPAPVVLTEDCALCAAVLAQCGQRLGEVRYTQAAQRAVGYLTGLPGAPQGFAGLPPSLSPCGLLTAQATCGASAALALALLTLGQQPQMHEYAQAGFRLLGAALHAFVREDGLPMHTPQDAAAFFPRIPAIYDGELPSPAATLVRALRLADALRPDAGYAQAIETIWEAAAPAAHAQPIACCALIDAVTDAR